MGPNTSLFCQFNVRVICGDNGSDKSEGVISFSHPPAKGDLVELSGKHFEVAQLTSSPP